MKTVFISLVFILWGIQSFAQQKPINEKTQKTETRKADAPTEKPIKIQLKGKDIGKSLSENIQRQFKTQNETIDEPALRGLVEYIEGIWKPFKIPRTTSGNGPYVPEPNFIRIHFNYKWTDRMGKEREIDIEINFP